MCTIDACACVRHKRRPVELLLWAGGLEIVRIRAAGISRILVARVEDLIVCCDVSSTTPVCGREPVCCCSIPHQYVLQLPANNRYVPILIDYLRHPSVHRPAVARQGKPRKREGTWCAVAVCEQDHAVGIARLGDCVPRCPLDPRTVFGNISVSEGRSCLATSNGWRQLRNLESNTSDFVPRGRTIWEYFSRLTGKVLQADGAMDEP